MKSIFKLLIDIGPLAVFFVFYTRSDLKTAILPFMIATIIAVLFMRRLLGFPGMYHLHSMKDSRRP